MRGIMSLASMATMFGSLVGDEARSVRDMGTPPPDVRDIVLARRIGLPREGHPGQIRRMREIFVGRVHVNRPDWRKWAKLKPL